MSGCSVLPAAHQQGGRGSWRYTGARQELMHLVDAVAWVQSDMAEAERRGIERDGGDEAAISFCKFGAGTAFTDQWITGDRCVTPPSAICCWRCTGMRRRSGRRRRPVADHPLLPTGPHRLPEPGQWFAPDAERHLLDRPRFCPMCGKSLDRGLTSESWAADERIFLTWCSYCSWTGNIVRFGQATIDEPEH